MNELHLSCDSVALPHCHSQLLSAYCFMNKMNSNLLLFSHIVFCLLCMYIWIQAVFHSSGMFSETSRELATVTKQAELSKGSIKCIDCMLL